MRKKNGTTIVEVLISIIIIAIVMGLLFNIFLQVRNEDESNQIQANFTINQATFVREIEEDMINYGVKKISSCTLSEANISSIVKGYESKYRCVKIDYGADYTEDNIGFLMIYKTFSKYNVKSGKYEGDSDTATWMIQYVRGHYAKYYSANSPNYTTWKNATQVMKEYPDEVDTTDSIVVKYTATTGNNAATINIPVINSIGEHYDIDLAFTFKNNNVFKCLYKGNSKFNCNCVSSATLCNVTKS